MLKKSLILGLVLILASYINAQNFSKEEAAIKKVIEDETYYADQKNYDKFSDFWVHEPYVYWSVTNPNSHIELKGWEAISKWFKNSFEESPEPWQRQAKKTDYNFRIIGKMAFVTFLEDGNASTRIMEQQNGKWRLVRMGVISSTAYQTLARQQKMKKFAGNWQVDNASIQVTPPWPNTEVKAINCSITYPHKGLRINADYHLKSPSGNWTFDEETTFADDSNKQKVAVLRVRGGEGWSEVYTGDCDLKDDGSLNFKMYRVSDASTVRSDETISWKSDEVIHLKAVAYSEDGKEERVISYDLVKKPISDLYSRK